MLIGDMADSLLTLDQAAISGQLPFFFLALLLNVLVVPFLKLWENLLLTRKGFAYDSFLMGRLIRKPLADIETIDSGAVTERLLEDSAGYGFLQLWLYSRPVILLGYSGVLLYLIVGRGYDGFFCLLLTALAGVKLLRASLRGKKKAELKRKTSEFVENRRTRQEELGTARDFLHGFGLNGFMLSRFRELFSGFEQGTGREKSQFEAWEAVLDFLCEYGVQLPAVLAGAFFVAVGRLSVGALPGGYLMLPMISNAWEYASEFVTALHEEPEVVKRLGIFYGVMEEDTIAQDRDFKDIYSQEAGIMGHDLSFCYPKGEQDVFAHLDVSVRTDENQQFSGPNGCGKSTLLSLIAGLYEPDSGRITDLAGKPLYACDRRQMVSLLEQDGAIFSGTVQSNLFSDDMAAAAELLDRLNFGKTFFCEVEAEGKNLSPGERKKLLLTRALLKEAPFLALDEPLNHLDADGAGVLEEILRNRRGILLISHRAFDIQQKIIRLS